MDNIPQIVVLNGMHRSGTMLFSRLINAFPDTYIIKDGIRIPWIFFRVESGDNFLYPRDCYRKPPFPLQLSKSISDIVLFKKILLDELDYLKLPKSLYSALLNMINNCEGKETYSNFFQRFFSKIAQETNAKTVGVKNTHMFQYAHEMLEVFPNMKWVNIIRDVRGWYCSTKVSHPLNVVSSALLWNKAASLLIEDNINKQRQIYLTFDELIMSRTKTLKKVCDFLNMNFVIDDEWIEKLNLTENDGTKWYPNSSYSKKGKEIHGDQNKRRKIDYKIMDTLPVYRWRKKLSIIEIIALRILSRRGLQLLGFLR